MKPQWKQVRFGDVAEISSGLVDPKVAPYLNCLHIGPENIESESGNLRDLKTAAELNLISGKFEFDDQSIVYSKIRPNLNKVCYPGFSGICSADAYVVKARNGIIDRCFLLQVMRSLVFLEQAVSVSMRTGMPKINQSDLNKLEIPLPPMEAQIYISNTLSFWDRGIRQLSDLIAAKVRFKQGLMQQLLTGKRRFPGFSEKWKFKQIETFLTESRISGTDGAQAKKLTVKLYGKGVIPKSESRAGSESTKYFRRKAGQFIYSKLDFLNGAFGIIPDELDGYESTLDLPAFDFNESVDPDWFLSFVIREEFYSSHLGLANGGRKARRVNPTDLLSLSIPFPTKSEKTNKSNFSPSRR